MPLRRASWAVALLGLTLLTGCGWLDRIFDPVDDNNRLITLEPKFPELARGESVVLQAQIVSGGGDVSDFKFEEDSGGTVVILVRQSDTTVQVTGVTPGRATVTASIGDDSGLAVVTVQ